MKSFEFCVAADQTAVGTITIEAETYEQALEKFIAEKLHEGVQLENSGEYDGHRICQVIDVETGAEIVLDGDVEIPGCISAWALGYHRAQTHARDDMQRLSRRLLVQEQELTKHKMVIAQARMAIYRGGDIRQILAERYDPTKVYVELTRDELDSLRAILNEGEAAIEDLRDHRVEGCETHQKCTALLEALERLEAKLDALQT